MDLHYHTTHHVTQLETLMMQAGAILEALARESEGFEADSLLQHLRNTISLLSGTAQGYAWTVDEMLPLIAILADNGEISDSAAQQILAPAYENLGDEYTDSAMSYIDAVVATAQPD